MGVTRGHAKFIVARIVGYINAFFFYASYEILLIDEKPGGL
jgi:hypothetical protein